jgi:hypothetical protein
MATPAVPSLHAKGLCSIYRVAEPACLGLVWLWVSLLWPAAAPLEAQERPRARAAAESVQQIFGTEAGLTQHGAAPLSTDAPMRTVGGQPFQARLACEASQQYLRVTMRPAGTADIASVTVELDRDLDQQVETALEFTGPFAGVCNNGLVQCTAGTWEGCRYLRWSAAGAVPALEEVPASELGACYCINQSCGANLLFVNARKIVADIGGAILTTAQQILPRIGSGRSEGDDLSISYFGQRSACGVDRSPEQYATRAQDLPAAGLAAADTPGTVAAFMRDTAVSRERGVSALPCRIERAMETASFDKTRILRQVSSTRGTAVDCGPGCLRFRIGDEAYSVYGGGSGGTNCRLATETQQYLVESPERITRVTMQSATFDDALRLTVGGALAYVSRPGWSAPGVPAPRCDYGNYALTPNTDLTALFQRVGSVPLAMEVAHDRRGEGWVWLEATIREGCDVIRDEVIDGCVAAAANPSCRLRHEWVDDVQTVRDFRTTGLGPLPSSRAVGLACQTDSGPRAWWVTRREYECRVERPAFDGAAAVERYQTIHDTFDPTNGAFTDRREVAPGLWTLEAGTLQLPAIDDVPACTPMCRTRRARAGVNAGTGGPQSTLNPTGVPYDFAFRECDATLRCPAEDDEEIVSPCDCRSNFAQAAALMQTLRLVGEDMACEP